MVSADPLSGVEAPLAALSGWAGELSWGDATVLSPAGLWPIAVTGAAKLKKHNAMRRWCEAMRPESIGLRSSLQVYSAGKVCAGTYTGVEVASKQVGRYTGARFVGSFELSSPS